MPAPHHSGPVARATSANSSSVKSVSQLTVQLTEIVATGPQFSTGQTPFLLPTNSMKALMADILS